MMSCSTGPELYTVSSPAGETDASNLEPVKMCNITYLCNEIVKCRQIISIIKYERKIIHV